MYTTPYNIKSDYGSFHVYAFTMTVGIIVAVLASYIKSQKKGLPGSVLLLSVIFIVPSSLFFGSFFGKIDFTDVVWSDVISYFEFWDPTGGMSIHGGVLGGVIAGIIFFIYPAKKYKISMWVWCDTIIPNILLGQAIGRWGNFFNHELLGLPIDPSKLSWLPKWISANCWQWSDYSFAHPEYIPNTNIIQYREPIFLFESLLDASAWLIITFVIPNIGKWLGPKPWNKFNNKYKTSFKYSFIRLFNKKYNVQGLMTYKEIWNQEYYECKVENSMIKAIPLDRNYSRNLQSLHNPNRFWIVKCGAEVGAYLFFWNTIRLFLETQRDPDELFLINLPTIDYTVISFIAIIGLILIFISQVISPYHMRKTGWLYEKEF